MKLRAEERTAIFRGDYRALRRKTKPPIKGGEVKVLSWTRGGRQVVDRESGATVEIPRKPTVWVEFKAPELSDGEWIIRFTAHDEREPLRLLASTPGPSTPGLKTRQRKPEDVPKRGEQREPWTKETERGYIGTSVRAIDPAEGVDDEALRAYSTEARANFAQFRVELREDVRRKRERAIRDRLRETLKGLDPYGQVELLAAIERAIQSVGGEQAA